jgi:phage terminase large subunit-like protein
MLGDEVWCWTDESLLEAFQTALVKRPDARLLVISTAAATLDSPLGRLRTRALAGTVTRAGAFLDARAVGLRLLEWSVADDADPDDLKTVKRANPAKWITLAALREQQARRTPLAWRQFHACRWYEGAAQWLPHGAWDACRDDYEVEPGETVTLGVDIGGSRAASAVVAITDDLRIAAVHVLQGDDSVLAATAAIRELAAHFTIREVAYDPWRYHSEALHLADDGLP